MNSLFVLALPRSLSTLVYHVARLSLDLIEPVWTSDGEILNTDRYVHYAGQRENEGLKYLREENKKNSDNDKEIFKKMNTFLNQVTVPKGFIYKDVVNPFVASHWLNLNHLNVLKIKRVLADVVYSMMQKKWFYPAIVADNSTDIENAIIQGLLLAEKTIDGVKGETIDYDALVNDDQIIFKALKRLYPGENIQSMGYVNDEFKQQTEEIQKRRKTDIYKRIEQKIHLQKQTGLNYSGE